MVTTTTNSVPAQLLEEIQLVPQDKLPELTRFVRIFRLGLEAADNNINQPQQNHKSVTMQFAGTWADMPDDQFQLFLDEIAERRSNAFSGRPDRESMFD